MGLLHSLGGETGEGRRGPIFQVKVGSPCFLLPVRIQEDEGPQGAAGWPAGRCSSATQAPASPTQAQPLTHCVLSLGLSFPICVMGSQEWPPLGLLGLTGIKYAKCLEQHLMDRKGEHSAWWPLPSSDDSGPPFPSVLRVECSLLCRSLAVSCRALPGRLACKGCFSFSPAFYSSRSVLFRLFLL